MLSEKEAIALLSRLCIDLGFCVPPVDAARLNAIAPKDPRGFTDAVFLSEGLDPQTADRHLYRRVLSVVADAFRRSTDAVELEPEALLKMGRRDEARAAAQRAMDSSPTDELRANMTRDLEHILNAV
jgi:hypothetical protein